MLIASVRGRFVVCPLEGVGRAGVPLIPSLGFGSLEALAALFFPG